MFNSSGPERKSLRLKGYDYSSNSAYFITICLHQRVCLCGDIIDGQMCLNDVGKMIGRWWIELEKKFLSVELDSFIVMPNHIHGILVILEEHETSLPDLIQWYKTMTTNAYIRGVRTDGWESFPGRLWQRSYYDHIIRNEADLSRVRAYIENNPTQWEVDNNHPNNKSKQDDP